MHVENVEINGFKIDKFNQYDLEPGATQGKCPVCSHNRQPKNQSAKCASYDWGRGIGTCHNCNSTFQLHTYQRRGERSKEYSAPETVSPPVGEKAAAWFEARGISISTLVDMQVSEGIEFMPQTGKEENTIQFNYFMGGQLVNIKYRDGRKHFKLFKGAEKVFYNIDNTIGYDDIVIVEGEMDALALWEAGIKYVVSVPNGATLNNNNLDYLDNCIDYFLDKKRIIIAVDNDGPGDMLRQELVRRLGAEACFIVEWGDVKDANEYLLAQGKDALKRVVLDAKPVPLENVVTMRQIEGEVIDFVENGFKPGYQIGLDNFDDIFSTYTGQFITVTGIPSSGKSDFVDQMAVGYNMKYGWKIAYASPENVPTYLHAHKIMRKLWEGMPDKSEVHSEKWKSIVSNVNDNYFWIDMERYSLESVLKKGAELVKRKGIKCLVIDPFNKVRDIDSHTDDVNKYTMEYLTKIEMFCKKYDVLVIVVAHPTKMYKTQSGEMEEPTMYNIKGGGEWYDASYHGLLVHRDYDRKLVKVKVLKVKFQNLGENGAECWFSWDYASGLYVPHIEQTFVGEKMPWE
ncbi:MAG: toprim domain-containing protein [candidate division WOR-3 bacterium]|nr:toprim domain-containing protein [candidate division WOR-3 bacterium]